MYSDVNIKHCILNFVGALLCLTLNAQNNRVFMPQGDILSPKSNPGFYYLSENVIIHSSEIFTSYPQVFGLSRNDEMRELKSTKDELHNTHTKYQQYYKGIPVDVGRFIVHARKDESVYMVNGNIIRDLNLPSEPQITEVSALEIALREVPADLYIWQDESFENIKKEIDKDPEATYFPKGRLCIYPMTRNEDLLTQDFSLGWEFDIYVLKGGTSTKVFVDAISGHVENKYKLGLECNPGTGNTIHNGNQTINTQFSGGNYKLINDCQATIIHTYDHIGDSLVPQATEFTDLNNVWDATSQRSPVQTHYAAERTYNYFASAHNRLSWNGAAGPMSSYHGTNGISYANACWDCVPDAAVFGIGPSSVDDDDWNTLDIVGHEFGHGVVETEINSLYYAETGALNESFADIFGEMVEQTAEGTNETNSAWLMGEDRGLQLRSFSNPNSRWQPDTYEGDMWFNVDTCTGQVADDACGVHTNSGVQNHWFYLLAVGGSGTNDNDDLFSVSGVGNSIARNIAYYNLVSYMTPTSKYLESRNGCIQAAEDFYGVCSNAAIQTAKAWYAVGGDVDHLKYNAFLNCFTQTSNAQPLYTEGIRSLRLSHTVCGMSSATSTNYNIYFRAGKYIDIKHDSEYKATGTSAVIIAPNDCAFTVH